MAWLVGHVSAGHGPSGLMGKAAIEADFLGTHTGEFAGIQPTGRAVRVPYSVVYDLRGDKISGLRIYFPMSLLIEQLTG
jgi:predicted ester cyclase